MRLLFVCTGNVCRSPLAARLAEAWATEGLGSAASHVEILSAGLGALVDRPMDTYSAAALRRLGGDPTGARGRAFTADMAENADLVLTMTRRQRSLVLQAFPRGLRRTFTLLEAADLLAHGDASGLEQLPLRDRARELARRLHAARTTRLAPGVDDITDPIGRSASVHRRVAEEIADALRPLATALWPVTGGATQLSALGEPSARSADATSTGEASRWRVDGQVGQSRQ